MKKIHIVGKNFEAVEKIKIQLQKEGYIYSEEDPELVITYGGDGMFLIAERIFPQVPKILVRDSEVGNKCNSIDPIEAIKKFCKGEYTLEETRKLKATHRGRFEYRELIGVNDIVIRNSLPTEAIRFRYRIISNKKNKAPSASENLQIDDLSSTKNENDWSNTLIGDGLVISTQYGSTKGAYFYSITQKSFDKGIGVAFNNTTEKQEHIILEENDTIEIEVIRGIGVLVTDNNRDFINLETGDKIKVRLIDDIARRVILK
jgi:NAD+ kinase